MVKIPHEMKAVLLTEIGADFKLMDAQISVPTLSDQEVLIKIEYVGLTALDAKFAQQGTPCWQYPRVFGLDAVGIVVAGPKGVHPEIGTRVMWHNDIASEGVLSEYVKVPNFALTMLPFDVNPARAASLPTPGMTALIALYKLQLEEGDSVFIEAGNTCVGQLAVQMAHQQGLTVVTSSPKHCSTMLKKLGAELVVDENDDEIGQKIHRHFGYDTVNGVIDVSGKHTNKLLDVLQFCGRISCVSGLTELDEALLFKKAPNIGIVSLPGAWLAKSICAQQRMSFLGNMLTDYLQRDQLCLSETEIIAFDALSIYEALSARIKGNSHQYQVIKVD
jgi:NADPH:quinone reductase-like Zn-dependent oxidoreductase